MNLAWIGRDIRTKKSCRFALCIKSLKLFRIKVTIIRVSRLEMSLGRDGCFRARVVPVRLMKWKLLSFISSVEAIRIFQKLMNLSSSASSWSRACTPAETAFAGILWLVVSNLGARWCCLRRSDHTSLLRDYCPSGGGLGSPRKTHARTCMASSRLTQQAIFAKLLHQQNANMCRGGIGKWPKTGYLRSMNSPFYLLQHLYPYGSLLQ